MGFVVIVRTPAAARRMIVGVADTAGMSYANRLLRVLRTLEIETHLVVTRFAKTTLAGETRMSMKELRALASAHYAASDLGAAITSGSFKTMGMIVAPCSMRTLAEIASCVTSNLLTRAADVCLRERRRLVLMVGESPLHAGHLKAMLAATEAGAIIFPPVPVVDSDSQSPADVVDHSIRRILDLFDIESRLGARREGVERSIVALAPIQF